MRGVVNGIVERKDKNGKPYWRVEVLDRLGRGQWFTLFEPPSFGKGEEIDYIAVNGRLVHLRTAQAGTQALCRALLVLAAALMGARTPEDALALAEEMERYVLKSTGPQG